ncbi:MAG: hypothetical protein SNG81_10165 [Rikenellaceae bacterium]
MKSIKYLFCTLIAAAMFGCTEDATYEPGPVDDNTDCAALYFLAGQSTYFSFDKENDVLELELKVGRAGDSSAASTHLLDLAMGDTDIFSYGFIEFGAGETETTVTLSFPNAVEGTSYPVSATFQEEDKAIYTSNSMSHYFTVFIDYPWVLMTGENGETKGVWTEGLMGGIFSNVNIVSKEVDVYYTEGIPGLYRITNIYTGDFVSQLWGCTEEELLNYPDDLGIAIDPATQDMPIYTYIHAEDPDTVWIEWQNSGYYLGAGFGYFCFGSLVPDNDSACGYVGSSANYGTEVDGYVYFPTNTTLVSMDEYDGAWYGGSDVSLLLPGGTVSEPEEPEVPEGSSSIEGEHTLSGYSYFDSAWYTEAVTISYVDESTGEIEISGLFYGYSPYTISAVYDATALTITIPDWQLFGTFSFGDSGNSDVYFANANDSNPIVFVSDGSSFVTTQMWGYYIESFDSWYDVYTESSFDIALGEAGEGGGGSAETDPSLPAGSYKIAGFSYFDEAWFSETVSITYVDSSTGEVAINGMFYGYSSATVTGTFDAEAQTITIPDWQNMGTFEFDGIGSSAIYFANGDSEDPIVFTFDGSVFSTAQSWGYCLADTEGYWYDVYTESYISAASSAPAVNVAPKAIKNIEQIGFNELSVAKSASLDSAKAVKSLKATSISKSSLKINSISNKRVINPKAKAL